MRSKESLNLEMKTVYTVMRKLSRETLWFNLQEVKKTFPEYDHSTIHAIMFFLVRDGLFTRKYNKAHHEIIYKTKA
jgi:hypothetical protein